MRTFSDVCIKWIQSDVYMNNKRGQQKHRYLLLLDKAEVRGKTPANLSDWSLGFRLVSPGLLWEEQTLGDH